MQPADRRKLIAERRELKRLTTLYRRHVVAGINAIRKFDRRIIRINWMLEVGK